MPKLKPWEVKTMLEKLNAKLEEIRRGKEVAQKNIAALDRQREQAVANLNAFVGAEQVILQLIDEESEVNADGDTENND